MSTLAASFLHDFDSEDEGDLAIPSAPPAVVKREPPADEEGDEEMKDQTTTTAAAAGSEDDEDEDEDGPTKPFDASGLVPMKDHVAPSYSVSTPLTSISSLLHSSKLQHHLQTIDAFRRESDAAHATSEQAAMAASSAGVQVAPSINKDVEYPYIVYSNELAFEIDSHIAALHKLARDLYAPRYAELEQLVSNPVQYARVASAIGNEMEMARISKLLAGTGLANNVMLTISVTATTTRGKPLGGDELEKLRLVCQTILDLDAAKAVIHSYISSRMAVVAPNVSAMLGSDLASQIVALAGGVKKLSEIPGCNLQVLGRKGKQQSGLSRVAQGEHEGLIVNAPVMQGVPKALRTRALRLLANKLALAARQDSFASDDDDSSGRALLQDIREKIDKWQEPAEAKLMKALPIPLQKSKPKRGGKRYRKEKERMAETEVSKQKNRVFMGKEEVVDEYTGEGMGMIGQEGSGVLRIKNKDAKLAKRLSQKTQARLKRVGGAAAAMAASGTITSLAGISGTTSSIAFTPAQGMQLVKTQQIQRVQAANASYFSATGSFAHVHKPNTPTTTAASLKRPLPPVPTFAAAAAATTADGPAEKKQKTG